MNEKTNNYRAERSALRHAIARCHKPDHVYYHNYGGRTVNPIHVCPEWRDPHTGFQAFLDHIGPRPTPAHTLDRIDNDRGYEPGNVRWCGEWKTQMLNRRKMDARIVRDFGWGLAVPLRHKDGRGSRTRSPLLPHAGRMQTLSDWADELGLKRATISQRLMKGLPVEQALNPILLSPRGKPRANQPNGER